MFGFVKQSTYAAAIADVQAANDYLSSVVDGLRDDNKALKETNYALDRTAAKYKKERDALAAQLQPFLDRQARAKLNLKQFRNGAAAQAVVS